MTIAVFDDMGRKVLLSQPIKRIVSLVPSDTETCFELGAGSRLVGCTRYCVEPAGLADKISTVGGTKDVNVDAVIAARPDLILANQEENTRKDLEALAAANLPVFVSFPKRYNDALAHVARLARILGPTERAKELLKRGYARKPQRVLRPCPVFVPIWRDPLMTFSAHTYSHDMLELAGFINVFSDRKRQYPLAADLGLRSPLPADQVAHRDVRYPRITEGEIVERAPEVVLLPNEPYNFTHEDRDYFSSLDIPAARAKRIVFVDGKDLFWPGSRSEGALARLVSLAVELTQESGVLLTPDS